MTRRWRELLLLVSLVGAAPMWVACSSDDEATKPDEPATSAPPPAEDPPAPAEPAEPTPAPAAEPAAPAPEPAPAAPAPAPAPEKAAPPPPAKPDPLAARRSADGIDDETPLPTDKSSPALQAFEQATSTAQSNPQAAVSQFVQAAQKTNYFYAAWFNAGAAAEAAGDAANAEKYYREALKVRPDYANALINLYLLLKRSGKAAQADKLIDDALAKHGDRAGPHVAAAMRARTNNQRSQVEAEALKAIRIDERQVPAMHLMAWVFYEEGRYETARFALENALALEPGNALLHLDLGHVLLKLDDEKKAMDEFGKAAKLRPALAEAQENYGVLLLKFGYADLAIPPLQKTVQLRPKSATAQNHLGNALRAQKQYKPAEAAYKKALELDPELHEVHFNLGVMYLDNELEGLEELQRLELSVAELKSFSDKTNPTGELKTRINDYRKTLKKRIKREKKRLERAAERAALEEEKKKGAGDAEGGGAEGGDAEGGDAEGGDAEGGDAAAGNPDAAGAVEGEGAQPEAGPAEEGEAAPAGEADDK